MLLSVCIPCYNSEKTIAAVVSSVKRIISAHGDNYQIILCNDCSTDNTFKVITALCSEDNNIIGIDLIRNYGQASAKLAAVKYAEGDAVVLMDDDGQHPAEYIYKLLEKLQQGNDVVYGYFPDKKHSLFKRLTSRLHHWLAVKMGTSPKEIHTSPFQIWNKTVANEIKKYHSPFVSLGGYMRHITTKHAEVAVPHFERKSGKSGYTLKKLLRMWSNIFFSFTMKPLRLASLVGIAASVGGFCWSIFLFVKKIIHPTTPVGYTSTNIIILILGGLVLFSIGIVGEYIGRIYMTISGMPQYTVRTVINHKGE